MRFTVKANNPEKWHKWFAWHPVKIKLGNQSELAQVIWLETIWRKLDWSGMQWFYYAPISKEDTP